MQGIIRDSFFVCKLSVTCMSSTLVLFKPKTFLSRSGQNFGKAHWFYGFWADPFDSLFCDESG
jgi:hypothetical protein